jgi:hypothetical protein
MIPWQLVRLQLMHDTLATCEAAAEQQAREPLAPAGAAKQSEASQVLPLLAACPRQVHTNNTSSTLRARSRPTLRHACSTPAHHQLSIRRAQRLPQLAQVHEVKLGRHGGRHLSLHVCAAAVAPRAGGAAQGARANDAAGCLALWRQQGQWLEAVWCGALSGLSWLDATHTVHWGCVQCLARPAAACMRGGAEGQHAMQPQGHSRPARGGSAPASSQPPPGGPRGALPPPAGPQTWRPAPWRRPGHPPEPARGGEGSRGGYGSEGDGVRR